MSLPLLLTFGVALLGGYALLMSRFADALPRKEQAKRLICFVAGEVAVLVAFLPSFVLLGAQYRFTANMVQFMLLSSVAPPLLYLGLPTALLEPFARRSRRLGLISTPLFAYLGANAVFLGWHIPFLFEASSRDLSLWLVKQTFFLLAGVWAWLPVMGPLKLWQTLGFPAKILYLFFLSVPTTILGALFGFAPDLIYGSRALAFEICAPASLGDQQAGGLLMWNGCAAIDFAVFALFFFKWYGTSDDAQVKHL